MEVPETMDLYTTNSISFLKVYRMNSLNIQVNIRQLPSKIGTNPLREEINRMSEALRSFADFYVTAPPPEYMEVDLFERAESIAVIAKLKELMDKANNNSKINRYMFYESAGLQNLVALTKVMINCYLMEKVADGVRKRITSHLNEVLNLVNTICLASKRIPKDFSNDDDLICLLFNLFEREGIFESHLAVLESLLIGRDQLFPLQKIKNFYKIIEKFNRREFGLFSNILAILSFEHSNEDFSSIFVRGNGLCVYPECKQVVINQAVIINIPHLLPRFINLIE